MRLRLVILLTVLLASVSIFGTISRQAGAAESMSAAVDELANRLVGSRADTDPPIRVAVNLFSHSDRRATQFSNFVMIALTGRMVELGGQKVRVIERAQLESALRELELGDVPLFDNKTAKELGRFLNVDALVVGEVTTLTDRVRVDSRLIAIDTVETMVSANAWVPLTPTVQRQLETTVVVAQPKIGNDVGPDLRNGIWRGQGSCGDLTFGLAIAMVFNPDNTIAAMQSYFPLVANSGMESGVLEMEGTFDPATDAVKLQPAAWLYQPTGHSAIAMKGTIDANRGRFKGRYENEACGEITLTK